VLGLGAVQEQGVGLVEEEDTFGGFGLPEGGGDGLLGSADPHTQKIGGPALDGAPVEGLGEVAD
jgi:hypothetical protein